MISFFKLIANEHRKLYKISVYIMIGILLAIICFATFIYGFAVRSRQTDYYGDTKQFTTEQKNMVSQQLNKQGITETDKAVINNQLAFIDLKEKEQIYYDDWRNYIVDDMQKIKEQMIVTNDFENKELKDKYELLEGYLKNNESLKYAALRKEDLKKSLEEAKKIDDKTGLAQYQAEIDEMDIRLKYNIPMLKYKEPKNWKDTNAIIIRSAKQSVTNMETQKNMPNTVNAFDEQYFKQQKNYIAIRTYQIEHNLPPYQTGDFWDFFGGMLEPIMYIINLLVIIVAGGIVSSEFSKGTIKLLLIRPFSRLKILMSKYVTSIIFSLELTAIGLIFTALVGLIFYGANINTQFVTVNSQGVAYVINNIAYLFIQLGFLFIPTILVLTLAFSLSAIIRNTALATGLPIFLYFIGNAIIPVFLMLKLNWGKFLIYPNWDLSVYFFGKAPAFSGMTLRFSIIVIIVYFIALFIPPLIVFKKRGI